MYISNNRLKIYVYLGLLWFEHNYSSTQKRRLTNLALTREIEDLYVFTSFHSDAKQKKQVPLFSQRKKGNNHTSYFLVLRYPYFVLRRVSNRLSFVNNQVPVFIYLIPPPPPPQSKAALENKPLIRPCLRDGKQIS